LKKRTKKLLLIGAVAGAVPIERFGRCASSALAVQRHEDQKFFGSFLQKRTSYFTSPVIFAAVPGVEGVGDAGSGGGCCGAAVDGCIWGWSCEGFDGAAVLLRNFCRMRTFC